MGRKSKRNIVNINDYRNSPDGNKNTSFFESSYSLEDSITEKVQTAIYARLSVLKDNEKEDSLENQISLIERFVINHPEMEIYDVYADKDRTGTNFDRPEFERMIADATRGKISCIVVKDLSRFGRNYIESGVFIENVFPKIGVRLIAINDNFDSNREEDMNSLAVPVKNMINEMYAKDISRKIISSNKIRNRKADSKLRGNAPYGYKYEENKLVIDERYAPYVRMIFAWSALGVSAPEIAKRLTLLGAPIPGNVTGDKNTDKFGNKWLTAKVYNILKNPEYTGDSYRGRYETNKFGGYSKLSSEDNWLVYSGTHDPLVTREDYMLIDKNRKEKDKKMKDSIDKNTESRDKLTSDFPGLIFCAECNKSMTIKRDRFDEGRSDYTHRFYCCTDKGGGCCYKKVSVEYLKMIITEQIKCHLKVLCDRAEYLKEIRGSVNSKNALSIDKKISSLEKQLIEAKEKNIKLYEDYVSGILELEDYRIIKEKTSADDSELRNRLNDLYKEKNHQLREIDQYINMIDDLDNQSKNEISNDVIMALIHRVYVSKDDRIEIIFKNEDIYDELFDFVECDKS